MRIVIFCHSLLSDWNHGNAHFLRGVITELISRGHDVPVYEPSDSWSYKNLVSEHGYSPVRGLLFKYPWLSSIRYDETLDVGEALDGAELVIVHEWNSHELVRKIGDYRKRNNRFRLFFHDTHHRSATDPQSMAAYDLSGYDGVLAFGEKIKERYLSGGWAQNAWTWHEAADARIFYPLSCQDPDCDLVWIGNWGDGERAAELEEFLLRPAKALGLRTVVHGVRYPQTALRALEEADIEYKGWIANYTVPYAFSRARLTVHIPRSPYAKALAGIPTIRVFEALACGIPLVSSPWEDSENLFTAGSDYIVAKNGKEMEARLDDLMNDSAMRRELSLHGRRTILERHTCSHRVDELLGIYDQINRTETITA